MHNLGVRIASTAVDDRVHLHPSLEQLPGATSIGTPPSIETIYGSIAAPASRWRLASGDCGRGLGRRSPCCPTNRQRYDPAGMDIAAEAARLKAAAEARPLRLPVNRRIDERHYARTEDGLSVWFTIQLSPN